MLTPDGKREDVFADELIIANVKVFTKGFIVYGIDTLRVLVIDRARNIVDERLKKTRRIGNDL